MFRNANKGFSLTELIIVIAIISALLAIGTLSFNRMNRKAGIESQIKKLYADLQDARSRALFEKTVHSATFTSTSFTVSRDGSFLYQRNLNFPMAVSGTVAVDFDNRGLAADPGGGTFSDQYFCISGNNDAVTDSVIVSLTRIHMGKRTGGSCDSAGVIIK